MTTGQELLKATFAALLFAGAVTTSGTANASERTTPGPGEPTLAEVRRATERFLDVNVALAEGYIRDPFNMPRANSRRWKGCSMPTVIARSRATLRHIWY